MLSVRARPVDYEKAVSMAKDMPHERTRVRMSKTCARKVWDNYQVICEIRKTDRLKFVIAGGVRDGWRCLIIREFYQRRDDKTWRPGRDGIIIPMKSPLHLEKEDGIPRFIEPLPDMLKALVDAAKYLEGMELYSQEHEIWILPKVRVKESYDEDQ